MVQRLLRDTPNAYGPCVGRCERCRTLHGTFTPPSLASQVVSLQNPCRRCKRVGFLSMRLKLRASGDSLRLWLWQTVGYVNGLWSALECNCTGPCSRPLVVGLHKNMEQSHSLMLHMDHNSHCCVEFVFSSAACPTLGLALVNFPVPIG